MNLDLPEAEGKKVQRCHRSKISHGLLALFSHILENSPVLRKGTAFDPLIYVINVSYP